MSVQNLYGSRSNSFFSLDQSGWSHYQARRVEFQLSYNLFPVSVFLFYTMAAEKNHDDRAALM